MDPNVEGWKSIADKKTVVKSWQISSFNQCFPRASINRMKGEPEVEYVPPSTSSYEEPAAYAGATRARGVLVAGIILLQPFILALLWDPFLDHLQKVQICARTPVRSLWMFKIQKIYPFFENPICNSSANQCNAEDFACRSMSPVCLSLVALIYLLCLGLN